MDPLTENHVDYLIHQAGERHLTACEDHEAICEEIADPCDWPPAPASAPFCGCAKCVTREVLVGAWPAITRHVIEPLKHDARAMFLRGFIAGVVWAALAVLVGFAIGFFGLP